MTHPQNPALTDEQRYAQIRPIRAAMVDASELAEANPLFDLVAFAVNDLMVALEERVDRVPRCVSPEEACAVLPFTEHGDWCEVRIAVGRPPVYREPVPDLHEEYRQTHCVLERMAALLKQINRRVTDPPAHDRLFAVEGESERLSTAEVRAAQEAIVRELGTRVRALEDRLSVRPARSWPENEPVWVRLESLSRFGFALKVCAAPLA
jgi:hypothetical protein